MKQPPSLCLYLLLLGLLLLGGSAAAAQSSQPGTASLRKYEEAVRACHSAAQRRDLPGLRAATEHLLSIELVTLDAGRPIGVDNRWLREAVQQRNPDTAAIAGRLGAQLEVLASAHQTDPQALARLREILSQPPFVPPEPSRARRFLSRILDAIGRFLANLFAPFGGAALSLGELLVTSIAVIALLAVLFYIGRLLRGVLVREARIDDRAAQEPQEPTTSQEAMTRAQTLAAGQDYRTAVRYLYLSTVLWLAERGLLRYDRALTNHEVLQSIATSSPLRAALQPVVQTFERVWYGHHALDEPGFEQYRAQVRALREREP